MPFSNQAPIEARVSPFSNQTSPVRVGVGKAIAHHGELLQGVFPDEKNKLRRGLLTLPLPRVESIATFWPDAGCHVSTRPADKYKAAKAADLTFQELGGPSFGGCLTIESTIPVGCGYGSSTADVIAAIRATAAAMDAELRRSVICRLAVAAEMASDAVVFGEQAVLFAHREGVVIEYFSGEYPPLHVVGFISRDDTPVDTLAFSAARYDGAEIESFRVLRGLTRCAIREQNVRLLGQVATASARINQRYLPKKHFEELLRLKDEFGACGVQVAHSGNLMGLLFDSSDPDVKRRTAETARVVLDRGFTDLIRFAVNVDVTPFWG